MPGRSYPPRRILSEPAQITVCVDCQSLKKAARHARARGTSVSEMVAAYFRTLAAEPAPAGTEREDWEAELSPEVRRLLDRPPAPEVSDDDYHRCLEEKYR